MGDGSTKPIEELERRRRGPLRPTAAATSEPAKVAGVPQGDEQRGRRDHDRRSGGGSSARREHMHFAGYKFGIAPQMHLTYLMWKRGVGLPRRHVPGRTPTAQVKPTHRAQAAVACMEYADAAWVDLDARERGRRAAGRGAACRSGTGCPRSRSSLASGRRQQQSVVGEPGSDRRCLRSDRHARRRVAASLPTRGSSFDHPASPAADLPRDGDGTSTLTLCGERRRSDADAPHRDGRARPSRAGRRSRSSGSQRSAGQGGFDVLAVRDRASRTSARRCGPRATISRASTSSVRVHGALRATSSGPVVGRTRCRVIPAARCGPGWRCSRRTAATTSSRVGRAGRARPSRSTTSTSRAPTTSSPTGSSPTTRSTRFRGADIRNILDFERDFPDAETVLLEQNYRSTQTILDAANGLIAHNVDQKPKHLWTDGASGEQIVIGEFDDEHAEARYVASEVNRLVEEGTSRDRDRGLLPGQRPEPGARGHAGALRDPLPGDRRDEVLRARRDQGRGRLPAAARQPGRRDLVLADRQLAAARDRPADRGADALAREHDRRRRLGRAREPERRSRASAPPRYKAVGRFAETMAAPAPARRAAAARSPSCSRRRCTRPATSRRSRPSARSRPRAGSRTSRSWSASPASSTPTASWRASRRSARWRSSSPRSRSSPSRTTSARRRAWRR